MAVGDNTLRPFTLPVLGASAASLGGIIRSNDNILRQAHNAHAIDTVAHVQSGLLAARPAAPDIGTTYLSTDIGSEAVYLYTAAGWVTVAGGGGGGTGDVVGPGSSTDNAVARFDATTGKLLQNSVVLIDDTGNITGVVGLAATGAVTVSGASGAFNVNAALGGLGVQFQDTGVNRMILRLDSSTIWSMNPRTGAGAAIDSPLSLTMAANGTMALGGGGRQISINASASAFSTVAGFYVRGSYNPSSAVARGMRLDSTQIATANSDTLYGADFAPVFTPGAFTGLTVAAVRIADNATVMTGTKYGLLIGAQSGATVANHSLGVLGTSTFGGALTVTSGGIAVTGNSTITGTLGGLTGLTVASGGASITGGATIDSISLATRTISGASIAVAGASLILSGTHTSAFSETDNLVRFSGTMTGDSGGAYTMTAFRMAPTFDFGAASGTSRVLNLDATLTNVLGSDGITFLYIDNVSHAGASTTQGIYIGNMAGAGANYAIYTNSGHLRFGDVVGVGGATPSATTALATPAGTTGISSLRVPHGVAPTAPVNGDLWSTTAGFYGRVNGATVGPFGAGGGGGGASATTVEVDLGSVAKFTGRFTITDASITATSKVLCWQAPGPYTGKGTRADEASMQPVSVIAVNPATGSAVVEWQTPPSYTQQVILPDGRRFLAVAARDGQMMLPDLIPRRVGKVRGNVKFSYTILT